ncbi:MAG: type I secretion C-terminal target domain-containing protein [Rhizobiaceae bacterium]|nr:type I secretion C-terminal target domain-containing protein [Rhizobiaceae bacterium]
MEGYSPGASDLSSYVTAVSDGGTGTIITVDHDGGGAATDLVSVRLLGVGYTANLLDDLVSNGNLVLA